MLPSQIARLPETQKILFRRSQEPVILEKVKYYEHPHMRELAD
ncbi:MAG: type IV secretory system conjugative DNA transfer family protein [bacterium]|nr:type IV secretory system conjugative DNA transfer family protein [bacterium]